MNSNSFRGHAPVWTASDPSTGVAAVRVTSALLSTERYWLNWLCSFHGCRTGEIADATTHDIECVNSIWAFNITTRNRSKDQRLKTAVSTRKLALHQAVIDEGFIRYV